MSAHSDPQCSSLSEKKIALSSVRKGAVESLTATPWLLNIRMGQRKLQAAGMMIMVDKKQHNPMLDLAGELRTNLPGGQDPSIKGSNSENTKSLSEYSLDWESSCRGSLHTAKAPVSSWSAQEADKAMWPKEARLRVTLAAEFSSATHRGTGFIGMKCSRARRSWKFAPRFQKATKARLYGSKAFPARGS